MGKLHMMKSVSINKDDYEIEQLIKKVNKGEFIQQDELRPMDNKMSVKVESIADNKIFNFGFILGCIVGMTFIILLFFCMLFF